MLPSAESWWGAATPARPTVAPVRCRRWERGSPTREAAGSNAGSRADRRQGARPVRSGPQKHGKPVIALAGTIGENACATHDVGIDAYAGIIAAPVALDVAMATAAELLTDAAERTLRLVLVGAALT
jgi:hypothetical protein